MAGATTAAILGATGVIGSLVGGRMAGNAANDAAGIQAAAAGQAGQQATAAAEQAGQMIGAGNEAATAEIRAGQQVANDQLTAQLQEVIRANGVYSAAGQQALQQLMQLYGEGGEFARGFDAQALQQNLDPGFQFRQEQGTRAIEGSAAARGSVLSSRAMREVARFNSGLASQEIANAFQRFANTRDARTSALTSVLGVGANANAQTNQARMATGSGISANTMNASGQIGQNALNTSVYQANALQEGTRQNIEATTGAANALASGRVGSANAMARGISGAIGAGLDAYSIYRR